MKTPQELLRDAATAIDAALAQLDISEEKCSTCQSPHFINFAHAKVHQQFKETPTKLRLGADKLDEKHNHLRR